MQVIWSTEQVLGLASDENIQKSSRVLAVPEKWEQLGSDTTFVWGRYMIRSHSEFQVIANLHQLTFHCSCKNRKFPCNHLIALLLLAVEAPEHLSQTTLPTWAHPITKKLQPDIEAINRISLPSRSAAGQPHLGQLQQGLLALERWLKDVIRGGIANLPSLSDAAWDRTIGQLVDSRAPAIATEVRTWQKILSADPQWSDTLSHRIGRTYLLLQAFKNFDQSPNTTQNDLLRAVGWHLLTAATDDTIDDHWLVIGATSEDHGNETLRHTYLIGAQSGRAAQIIQQRNNQRQPTLALVTGSVLTACLQFVASETPLIATIMTIDHIEATHPLDPFTIANCYADLLTNNPFVGAWPHLIKRSHLWHDDNSWLIGDADGMMPLTSQSPRRWHLKALAGVPCFGLWNGANFHPLSVWSNGRLLDLRLLRGVG